jgi:hypothetical protein
MPPGGIRASAFPLTRRRKARRRHGKAEANPPPKLTASQGKREYKGPLRSVGKITPLAFPFATKKKKWRTLADMATPFKTLLV